MEDIRYEDGTGQLLSGSFMDYCMPRADNFCTFEIGSNVVPTPTNPLGVKGAGEAGAIPVGALFASAVEDALNVDERREALGMGTAEDQLREMQSWFCR